MDRSEQLGVFSYVNPEQRILTTIRFGLACDCHDLSGMLVPWLPLLKICMASVWLAQLICIIQSFQ